MPAYGEIWLGEARSAAAAAEEEPLYGKAYLPRKFKVAVGLPGDNCVNLYGQDVGLMAVCENFQVVGYNVLVGGGMGQTPRPRGHLPRPGGTDGHGPAVGAGGRRPAARSSRCIATSATARTAASRD